MQEPTCEKAIRVRDCSGCYCAGSSRASRQGLQQEQQNRVIALMQEIMEARLGKVEALVPHKAPAERTSSRVWASYLNYYTSEFLRFRFGYEHSRSDIQE